MQKFYVIVQGQRGPKREHQTIERATAEAHRLAELPTTHDPVYVLGVLSEVPCQTEFPRAVTAPPPAPPIKSAPKITIKKPKRMMGAA